MEKSTIYHIVNGDVVGNKISSLEGEVIVWREMYDMGPTFTTFARVNLKERANYFEELLKIPSELFLKNCNEQEERLENIPKHAEVVLWFEHDRYDQTMLLYLLNRLSNLGIENISMVSIDAYPGYEPFLGMGQLTEEQLVALYQTKKYLSKEQVLQGAGGWKTYSSGDPNAIEKWLANEDVKLPYVERAFRTHLTYFPSTKNGLNQVELLALGYICEGINTFSELFGKVSNARSDDGLSDFHFSAILGKLAKGSSPLVVVESELPNFAHPVGDAVLKLTEAGTAALDGNLNIKKRP